MSGFGAYIISCSPDDAVDRSLRLTNLLLQLRWWRARTDIPVFLLASGWNERMLSSLEEVQSLAISGGRVEFCPKQSVSQNRHDQFRRFYESAFDWAIMMDDDAILYDDHHNSGSQLFDEMMANEPSVYRGVDIFFPIDPVKSPYTKRWTSDPSFYGDHHVFKRNLDLKGSMFVVRNFLKEGRKPLMPALDFDHVGEDGLFAVEAVAAGYSVMRCWNIVVKELRGHSFFKIDRKAKMKAGNVEIVRRYAQIGMAMKPDSHLRDNSAFLKATWGQRPTTVAARKPYLGKSSTT